jgi:hypothetical protein
VSAAFALTTVMLLLIFDNHFKPFKHQQSFHGNKFDKVLLLIFDDCLMENDGAVVQSKSVLGNKSLAPLLAQQQDALALDLAFALLLARQQDALAVALLLAPQQDDF